jgi:hypothetical protein
MARSPTAKERAYGRLLQNPWYFAEFDEEDRHPAPRDLGPYPLPEVQHDHAPRAAAARMGNPYYHAQDDDSAAIPAPLEPDVSADASNSSASHAASAATERTMSKVAFRRACASIFAAYIPDAERGRLRSHHKAFIARNEARSADTRYGLVIELRKYDLSSIPGLTGHFNRERDPFTEQKLQSIEALFRDKP